MDDFKDFNFKQFSEKKDHLAHKIERNSEVNNPTPGNLKKKIFFGFRLDSFISKFNPSNPFEFGSLSPLKKQHSISEHLNALLSLLLLFFLIFLWLRGMPLFRQFDQLNNDVKEQAQIIAMENENNSLLENLSQDQKNLSDNIQKIYAAVPFADEKAESVISILEDIATSNRLIIDAIAIRAIPESQLYYDDLIGLVDVYEYTFNAETELPNILSFIGSLRSSFRLMDLMTLDIEDKGNGLYRAGFVVNAYSLAGYEALIKSQ